MLERDIQRSILEYLVLVGVFAKRVNVGMIPNGRGGFRSSTMKGMSDILGILPGGRFLAVEVKAMGGRLTKDQEQFLMDVNAAGGLGIVAYSAMDVRQSLEANGIRTKGAA